MVGFGSRKLEYVKAVFLGHSVSRAERGLKWHAERESSAKEILRLWSRAERGPERHAEREPPASDPLYLDFALSVAQNPTPSTSPLHLENSIFLPRRAWHKTSR